MTATVGLRHVVRLGVRRDRVLVPVWVAVAAAVAGSSASAIAGVYPTVADRVQAAAGINATGSLVALYGPIYDPTSEGALAMVKTASLGAALVAVLAIVVVVRHTRADEEAGRLDLLGATVLGRQAPLAGALALACGTSVLLGLVTTLTLLAGHLPAAGSLAFGAMWAASGVAFAAVAAVTAQLARTGRAATGLASAGLGGAYLLRGLGDLSGGVSGPAWPSWLSPLGWCQQVRPYAGDRWALLLLPLAFAVVLTAVAFRLSARRDLGGSLLADRDGPAAARPSLRTPLALAWRLQRATLLAWLLAFLLLGGVLGGMAHDVNRLLESPQAADLIRKLGGATALPDAFLAAELGFVGVFTAAFAVQSALRLRGEEDALHAEALLATGVGRLRWAVSHVVLSLLGSALLLVAGGIAAGAAYAVTVHDAGQVPRVLGAALAQLPAVWVLTGVVVAGFGIDARWAGLGWAALVAFLLLGEIGPLLRLDRLLLDLSPFWHVPKLPGGTLHLAPLAWLVAVAAGLVGGGLAAFARRDVG